MSAPLSRTRVERIVLREESKELPPALVMSGCSFAFYAMLGCTMRAIAQRKPASSRAMAVTILGLGMPR